MRVAVSLTYYACPQYVRRAVDSILQQTHRDLVLVVYSDGGAPPWPLLADIDDPRLVRYQAPDNHGPFFGHEAVRRACSGPCSHLLIQDADDWSAPERVTTLARAFEQDVVSATSTMCEYVGRDRYRIAGRGVAAPLNSRLLHRHWHIGLHSLSALDDIGGYYCGERIGCDTLVMNLLMMVGRVVLVEEPLYHRQRRDDSLTTDQSTGIGSGVRHQVYARLHTLYSRLWPSYRAHRDGRLSHSELCARLRVAVQQTIPAGHLDALARTADELRAVLP